MFQKSFSCADMCKCEDFENDSDNRNDTDQDLFKLKLITVKNTLLCRKRLEILLVIQILM